MNLELLLAALLTLAVETAFLALTYRRDAAFLRPLRRRERRHEPHAEPHPSPSARQRGRRAVYPLEAAVVAAEYAVYAYACGRSKKLFWLTLAANVLSYCLGLILFGHV